MSRIPDGAACSLIHEHIHFGGTNISLSISAGAARSCSVSISNPSTGNGVAADPTNSVVVTLQVDAIPSTFLKQSSSPMLPTTTSSSVLPAMTTPLLALRTLVAPPTSLSRGLPLPTTKAQTMVAIPPTCISSSILTHGSFQCHTPDSSAQHTPALLGGITAANPIPSPAMMSRSSSSSTAGPRTPVSSCVASSLLLSSTSSQCHNSTSSAQKSPTARAHASRVEAKLLHHPAANLMPCPNLGNLVQHQENVPSHPLSVRSSSGSTTASSADPTVGNSSFADEVPLALPPCSEPSFCLSSPASSSTDSPAQENLEPMESTFGESLHRRLCKSWSGLIATSSDEAGGTLNFGWPILGSPAALARNSDLSNACPAVLSDDGVTSGMQGRSKRAIQETDEACKRLTLALELIELLKPRCRAVREDMQLAVARAADVDLSATTLPDLMKVQDRLKAAVASAKSFYFPGVDAQASSQIDDASRAAHAFKRAIEVANSACGLLLLASEAFHERDTQRDSEYQEDADIEEKDVDVGGPQVQIPPVLHISCLQEIRRLLAKVLTMACEVQFSVDELQVADKARRKLHSMIQDLKGQVRVCCRLRNHRPEDKSNGRCSTVKVINETALEVLSSEVYEFDRIFAPGTQEEVFAECRDLVQSAIDGRNVTVFTYGQTASGKTYTMYGTSGEDEGIAPRAFSELFKSIERLCYTHDVTVTASMVELYQNKLYDMLCGKAHSGTIRKIREDKSGMVWIEGLVEVPTCNVADLREVLKRGVAQRATESHAMNHKSSRSHLIFTIKISSVNRSTGETINGKMLLCDLAGSERIKKTQVEGERQKEAIDINKSLAALGNVILAIATKKEQIPYRNHKLTQLMRDSLGGTAKTLMFVNSSTSPSDFSQTVCSLAYAARASRIYNKRTSFTALGT